MAGRPSFEWDATKDRINRAKHGVAFVEAQYAFLDPKRIVAEDLEHGDGERRYFCFGRVGAGVMTVRFTWRDGRVRIIGAGYWRKGKTIYEKQNSPIQRR
ncbi:MAG: BrnT family toxin [Bauldia sp.]